jgi:hypothetical protein
VAPSEVHLLAVGLASAGRFDEAIPVYRAAIEAAPDRSRDFRGMLMFGEYVNGNMAQAVALAKALEAGPDLSHDEHFNIGQVFWHHDVGRGRAHLAAAYDTGDHRRYYGRAPA